MALGVAVADGAAAGAVVEEVPGALAPGAGGGEPAAGALEGAGLGAVFGAGVDTEAGGVVAAVVADQVGLWWGVHHTVYALTSVPAITAWGLLAMVLAGAVFGGAGQGFARSTHALGHFMKQRVAYAPLRAMLGGAVVAAAVLLGDFDRYIGLGIPVIVQAFEQPLAPWDWLGKMVLTIASLGTGFKGGEVTPLFYIGATLGNALAPLLHLPFDLLAAVGFVAVFAGASNTPIASTLMAMELFGAEVGVFAAIACVTSYLFSGHQGIYRAQRRDHKKHL